MKHDKRLVVRGRQRQKIDPNLLVQVLLAIGQEWENPDEVGREASGVDAFASSVEDREAQP